LGLKKAENQPKNCFFNQKLLNIALSLTQARVTFLTQDHPKESKTLPPRAKRNMHSIQYIPAYTTPLYNYY
jgi:hypothetical protein